MFRRSPLLPALALACVLSAAPAAAQGYAGSIIDVLQQQTLHEVLQAQREESLRSEILRRNVAAPAATPAALPPLRLALSDTVARYERLHREQRRWNRLLLSAGAAALVGGFADHLTRDSSPGVAALPRALIWGGFAVTIIGVEQGKAAERARAEAEQWRSLHPTGRQPQRE
jgi:hypothetical protein